MCFKPGPVVSSVVILFKSSVTKRNLFGAGLLLARFKPQEAANRVKGIIQGWVAEID